MNELALTVISSLLGALLGVVALLLGRVWSAITSLQDRDDRIEHRIHQVELTVAEHYVTRAESQEMHKEVLGKLDRLDSKLERAAAKSGPRVTNFHAGPSQDKS